MMGGSMYKKNVVGVSGWTPLLCVWKRSKPITMPTTISKHDSGKIDESFGAIWKPVALTII